MNNTTKRAYVLYIFIVAFLAGIVVLIGSFYLHGGEWTSNLVNQHIYKNGQIAQAGSVYDVNGDALVYSKNGNRIYNSDKNIRKATLHAVGDNSAYISTGVQYVYSTNLSGYNFIDGVYNLKKYNRGNDINLTIDANICKTAYKALDGRKGSVGVYNYKTGEIICMVSSPTYDPQNKPSGMDNKESYDGVYLNRFVSGLYTPGSIFKIVTAICALENIPDIESRTFKCKGKYNTGDGTVICNGTHGTLTFEEALNHSCNSAFAQIANELGKEKLMATAGELGFNVREKLGEVSVNKSMFNVSDTTKTDLGWAGIGQYTTLVTPCHMLTLMGAIANGGTAVKPYFVKNMVSPTEKITELGKTEISNTVRIDPTIAAKMNKYLRSDVVNYYGDSRFPGLRMCGKTGTAEVSDGKPHSWFVGFSQNPDTPYAVVCVLENAGSGLTYAGSVANKVMQKVCKR